ncbi:MAG: preprotein translocase subunit YajC [Saprospiraceae bacterium]|nr:preprotein translocase subunit YajC [Saprospiraceae bacterium]
MLNTTLLLQANDQQSGMINIGFILLMFAVFWFFIIRPQSKKQKEQKNWLQSLEKGTDVVTASGILGKISKMEDDIITLEIGSKVFIRVTRNAVSKELTDSVYGGKDKA